MLSHALQLPASGLLHTFGRWPSSPRRCPGGYFLFSPPFPWELIQPFTSHSHSRPGWGWQPVTGSPNLPCKSRSKVCRKAKVRWQPAAGSLPPPSGRQKGKQSKNQPATIEGKLEHKKKVGVMHYLAIWHEDGCSVVWTWPRLAAQCLSNVIFSPVCRL